MNSQKLTLTFLLMFFACTPLYSILASDDSKPELYASRLQSVTVPPQFLEPAIEDMGLGWWTPKTYIYVVLTCDGNRVWTSPKKRVMKNQNRFEWPNTLNSIGAFPWKDGNIVTIRVFLSNNDKIMDQSEDDLVLFEKECSPRDKFPLDGSIEYTEKSLGEKFSASVDFKLLESKGAVNQGSLELGKKYMVHMRGVNISTAAATKGEKKPKESRYFVVLQQGENKYPFFKDDPISLVPDMEKIFSMGRVLKVLKNTGESTQLHIYEDDLLVNDLVFTRQSESLTVKVGYLLAKRPRMTATRAM